MQINQHNGGGGVLHTQFMCRTLIFYCFFFNFTFWAADDTGLLICCFWRGSSERGGRHFFFWSPKIEVWGVCKCQSELNEPIKNSKAAQSSWRRTLFLTSNQVLSIHFSRGLFRSSCHSVLGYYWSWYFLQAKHWMMFDNDVDKGPGEYTVFKNHRKSLIQHCERSELRLHFE